MVVGFVNTKGGVGKSTLAGSLAVHLYDRKKTVAFVDADHHVSSSIWVGKVEPSLPIYIIKHPSEVLKLIQGIVRDYEHIIIDGPGALDETTRMIVLACDTLVIPCAPGMLDFTATSQFVQALQELRVVRNGRPNLLVVKNKIHERTNLTKDLRHAVDEMGLPVSATEIYFRQVHSDVVGQRTTVERMAKLTKKPVVHTALAELLSLFEEVGV